ncbi:Uncharacterized protein FWK35_00000207 [Aphis craccivora]|uniref:Uncharacterized protein n=1 Tax=Aphis craccivora TaxID=307492 RepID=A0A6G0ZRI4_APHCR|nr:Uncharacterized protein FWK35_00000207 [Aphis craccivora]
MESVNDYVQNKTNHGMTDNDYLFDFEQENWNNQKMYRSNIITNNAVKTIERERENVEKDLKLLQAIEEEKSRLKNSMAIFIQLKNELEKKLEKS